MTFSVADLPWLEPAPSDVRQSLRNAGPENAGTILSKYAAMRLSAEEAATFAKALSRCREAGADLSMFSQVRLGLLSNATVDLLAEQLPAGAARHGVAIELIVPPYDQVQQQTLDPGSMINTAKLDAVLLAVDHRWLLLEQSNTDSPKDSVDAAVERLSAVVAGIRQNSKAIAIIQTLPVPPLPLFGSFDRRVAGSIRAMILATNERIVALADETGSYLFDVAALAERIGTDRWFDPVQWAAFKLPFSSSANAAYADALGRLLGSMRGKARKCLVLDLDNTVWGGVIGDDGMAGIKIGNGSAMGEAFLAVQAYALELRSRGIMLAVSSKNDDANARQPFREHADMLLREEHITVFQANWLDKASNLESIAQTLNIGLDALVFLDDNPAERAQMRAALPMVAVPELPNDPNWYPWFLASAGYFEALSFSDEDRLRVESYASEARRAEVKTKSRDLGDYLRSLGMVLEANPFNANNRPRITSLINKTNQFNLTTRRYTDAEIEAAEASPDVNTIQVRLKDRFGDFGMIGVVIARRMADAPDTWEIDSWLMSCRVLGRKVEEAMLARLVEDARSEGIQKIIGVYRPTRKNGMVKEHYPKLGFSARDTANGEADIYELSVPDYQAGELPMIFAGDKPNNDRLGLTNEASAALAQADLVQ